MWIKSSETIQIFNYIFSHTIESPQFLSVTEPWSHAVTGLFCDGPTACMVLQAIKILTGLFCDRPCACMYLGAWPIKILTGLADLLFVATSGKILVSYDRWETEEFLARIGEMARFTLSW